MNDYIDMPNQSTEIVVVSADVHTMSGTSDDIITSEVSNDGAEKAFNFDEWITENNVSRKTSKLLRDQDINNMDILKLMTQQELLGLGVTVGQVKTLMSACSTEHPVVRRDVPNDNESMSVPAPSGGTHNDANATLASGLSLKDIRKQSDQLAESGKQFDNLFPRAPNVVVDNIIPGTGVYQGTNEPWLNGSDGVVRNTHSTQGSGYTAATDPRTILTMKATNKKAIHITQFLSENAKQKRLTRRRDILLTTHDDGDDRLVVQSNEKHPYVGITIDEWGAANTRLMYHLMSTDDLPNQHIGFYLAYTVTIFDLAHKYEWYSIMNFDYQYREQQAQIGFQWGEINPLMEMQLLIPRQQHRIVNKPGTQRPQFRQQVEECRQWKLNRGHCPFGANCKFVHTPLTQSSTTHVSDPSKNWVHLDGRHVHR